MPQCSVCHRDLPGFDTLCSKCFDARYSELDHPESIQQSLRRYVSNPFGITRESEGKLRLPAAIAFCCGGVLLCWFGGFAEVGYKYSLFSDGVLSGALLILLKSAGLSLGMSLFLARRNLRLYWEVALGGVLGYLFMLCALGLGRRGFSRSPSKHRHSLTGVPSTELAKYPFRSPTSGQNVKSPARHLCWELRDFQCGLDYLK